MVTVAKKCPHCSQVVPLPVIGDGSVADPYRLEHALLELHIETTHPGAVAA